MRRVALLAVPLAVPTLLALPLTLTHLALLRLPAAVPVHRLPDKCPLLEVLDLSFIHGWGRRAGASGVCWSGLSGCGEPSARAGVSRERGHASI